MGTAETTRSRDLAEPLAWIAEMRGWASRLNVTMGNPYASPHIIRPFETPPPDGYESPEHPLIGVDRHFRLTAEIQARFPGCRRRKWYSYLQEFLPHAGPRTCDGRATFVGFGRGRSRSRIVNQLREHGALDRAASAARLAIARP